MPVSNRHPGTNPHGNHSQLLAWVPPFLEALSEGLNVREACRRAGTHPSTVYNHRAADEAFRACWNRAMERGTELLEQEAVRRAYHGVEKPVFYKGEQCGTVQDYSDSLLMFVLRARRPELYRDKDRADTNVNITTNVQANVTTARAIREMVANGEIAGLIEGVSQGERAPFVSGSLDDGRHQREMEAGASPTENQLDPSRSVAHPEQPDSGNGSLPTR